MTSTSPLLRLPSWRTARAPGAALLLFLVACNQEPSPTALQEVDPAFLISDGAHGGNQHFYFLNPLVPAPSPTGTFDASLEPVVEICELLDEDTCGPVIAVFNALTGPGSSTVRVSEADEQYIVNWHSGDFDLDPSKDYRLSVHVGAQELGFADVDVVSSGRELKNVATDEFVGLVDGRTLPVKFRIEEGALAQAEAVTTGYLHTCAVDAAGIASCAGYNRFGQLGNGSFNQSSSYGVATPATVVGGHTFRSVSAGLYHTCGVTTAGDGYCWGYNYFGQLGDGTVDQGYPYDYGKAVPVLVAGGHTWQSLAPGYLHTCGLTTDGDVYCWGYGGYGALGVGAAPYYVTAPQHVGSGYQSVRTLQNHTCAVTTTGEARCWGYNYYGTVGNGSSGTYVLSPSTVAGGHIFAEVDAGASHSCGTTTDGDAYCWGYNYYGTVGNGTFNNTYPYVGVLTPQLVAGGHTYQSVRAGVDMSCGLTTDGTGLCWGFNRDGQLGNGTFSASPPYGYATPQVVAGGHTFAAIDAGYGGCGTTTAGDVYCWGHNYYGELGTGSFDTSYPYGEATPALSLFDLTP